MSSLLKTFTISLVLQVNGKYILKSGTDFRNFSVVTLDFSGGKSESPESSSKDNDNAKTDGIQVEISSVDVTKDFEPDPELSSLLEKYKGKGPSRKDVPSKYGLFDPLPPPCPPYDVTVTTKVALLCPLWADPPSP